MEALNWIGPQLQQTIESTGLKPAQDDQLRHTCKEFESVLTTSMVKESLRGAMTKWSDDDEDSGGKAYMEMVQTQMGKFLGEQGMLGIADHLYEQLKEIQMPPPKL